MSSDLIFKTGITTLISRRLTSPQPTFVYRFNYRGATSFTDASPNVSEDMGVSHVDDLLYLFPMVKKVIPGRLMTDEDQKMRKHMVKMWSSFATHK